MKTKKNKKFREEFERSFGIFDEALSMSSSMGNPLVIDYHTMPPFVDVSTSNDYGLKVGDSVWIDSIFDTKDPEGKSHPEWLREKQVIESIEYIPLNGDEYTLMISIVGIPFIFSPEDLRK